MTVLRILQYPDPRLRKKAKKVTDFNDKQLQKDIDDMFETLYNTANCAGLAATQLDIADPFFVTVIDVSLDKSEPLCLINAEVIATEGEVIQWEGCMSVYPDEIHGQVARPENITARAMNREGKLIEINATGILAKCIQHEIDHLKGGLYVDHLSKLKQQMIDRRIIKMLKRNSDD